MTQIRCATGLLIKAKGRLSAVLESSGNCTGREAADAAEMLVIYLAAAFLLNDGLDTLSSDLRQLSLWDSDPSPAQNLLTECDRALGFDIVKRYGLGKACADPLLLSTIIRSISGFKDSLPALEPAYIPGLIYESFHRVKKDENRTTSTLENPAAAVREGIFYTPDFIVKKIVSSALGPTLRREMAPTVLDPSCGCGIFLIGAYRYLLEDALGYRWKKPCPDLHAAGLDLFADCIFGVDKDRKAVDTARLSCLLLFNGPKSLLKKAGSVVLNNIVQGNTLLDRSDFNPPADRERMHELGCFSLHDSFPQVEEKGGFDCVIGNPPYGLSRNNRLSQTENEKLKEIYRDFRCGKINKYMAFMAKALMLSKENGVCSMIVPNSWLGIKGGEKLRKLLLGEKMLSEISVYDFPVFGEPQVESVVFVVDKGCRKESVRIQRIPAPEVLPSLSFLVETKTCLNNPGASIPTVWSDEVSKLFVRIDKNSLPLKESGRFLPMIALQAYSTGKGSPPQSPQDVKDRVFDCRSGDDKTAVPYLEGRDISRYLVNWSGGYLKHGPWLAEPQTLERFTGPRIALREIISPPPYVISACFLTEPYLYNKSVLHILPLSGDSTDDLWALLAILNSKTGSFYVKFRGRKSQRKLFPKILNDDLKDFPLPVEFEKHRALLAARAREISAAITEYLSENRERIPWNTDSTAILGDGAADGILKIQHSLDLAVSRAYTLSHEDSAILSRVLGLG